MNKLKIFFKMAAHVLSQGLAVLLIVSFVTCTSTAPVPANSMISNSGTEISARGGIGRMEEAASGPLYTGADGHNIRLAIYPPEIQGDVPAHLPIYIQGLLNTNLRKYSAITLIDRQNMEKIISEQNIAANNRFSDQDFIQIGSLTNSQYYLFGTIQKLSGERYALQLTVTDSTTGVRRADFMKDGSLAQLEGNGTLINEAAADLLTQMGVELTETGRRTLLAGNSSAARAEAGIARGIAAMSGGDEVEALFNITQAIAFDSSNLEALSRLTTLSSSISGGTISQRIVNDLQARNRWLEVFRETASFFNDHPPFEITFDPNLVQIGQTDYAKGTADIGMRIVVDPLEAGFKSLNALLGGLQQTGRRSVWGVSGWPLLDIEPKTAGTVVFGGKHSLTYKVDVALINEKNKNLGTKSITLTSEPMKFSAGDTSVQAPAEGAVQTVQFSNVNAADLTPTLTIVIAAVNGIPSRELNATGYMKIGTGDLEMRDQVQQAEAQRRDQIQQAEAQRRDQIQRAQAQREKEAAAVRRKEGLSTLGYILLVGVSIAGCVILFKNMPETTTRYD
ncbi:MAG: hypothetical protein LBH43_12885 [Treponema sp.]|jgi:hypothetical protein|nr:hypothetical protein [Treponema sp.]